MGVKKRDVEIGSLPYFSTISCGNMDPLSRRLLRNWATVTALTISRNELDKPIWQTIVLRQALRNPYLLHGVLAISALHLAFDDNTKEHERGELIKTAESHQSEAIRFFTREFGKEPQNNLENFVLSSLLIGFAFAFPLAFSQGEESSGALEGIIRIITLIKSTMNLSSPMLMGVKSEEMSHLTHVDEHNLGGSKGTCPGICKLYEVNGSYVQDHSDREVFGRVISQLEDLFSNMDGDVEPVSTVFMWMCEIPTQFQCSLQQRHPFALAIFSYYCVALHRLRGLWWIPSWGQRVVNAIKKELSSEWKTYIESAVYECGK